MINYYIIVLGVKFNKFLFFLTHANSQVIVRPWIYKPRRFRSREIDFERIFYTLIFEVFTHLETKLNRAKKDTNKVATATVYDRNKYLSWGRCFQRRKSSSKNVEVTSGKTRKENAHECAKKFRLDSLLTLARNRPRELEFEL